MTEQNALPIPSLLLVDDSEADRELYKAWLAGLAYHVEEADDGEEGLELAQQQPFDCIIIDGMMLRMDGFQLLTELRDALSHVPPILFLTGFARKEAAEDAIALGADAFLSKDELDAESFCNTIKQLVTKQ